MLTHSMKIMFLVFSCMSGLVAANLFANETYYQPFDERREEELFGSSDDATPLPPIDLSGFTAQILEKTTFPLTTATPPIASSVCQATWATQLDQFSQGLSESMRNFSAMNFVFLYQIVHRPRLVADQVMHPLRTVTCGLGALHAATVATLHNGWQEADPFALGKGVGTSLMTLVTVGSAAELSATAWPRTLGTFSVNFPTGGFLQPAFGDAAVIARSSQLVAIPVTRISEIAATLAAGGASAAALGNVLHIVDARPYAHGRTPNQPVYRFNGVVEWETIADDPIMPLEIENEIDAFNVLSAEGKTSRMTPGQVLTLVQDAQKKIQVRIVKIFTHQNSSRLLRVVVEKLDAAGQSLPEGKPRYYILAFESMF